MYIWCKSDLVDHFGLIDWARDNYNNYDGEYSFLWHPAIIKEFERIKSEKAAFNQKWTDMWDDVGEAYYFDYHLVMG